MSFQFGNNLSVAWKKLKGGDYTVRTFEANKLWRFETVTSSIYHHAKYGMNLYRALYPENHKYFGNVANLSSSLYERVFTTQSIDPKLLWYYLDHNFYTEHEKEKNPLDITDDNTITYLWQSSSIMALPMGMFGEGIKEGSFTVTNHYQYSASEVGGIPSQYGPPQSAWEYTLIDDGHGNLIDTVFDESNFVPNEYNLLYIGFNEKYREFNYKNNKLDYTMDLSPYKNNVDIINPKLITYQTGIPTTNQIRSSGVSANFNGSYLYLKNKDRFNFNSGSDFAFSFWINIPPTQSILTNNFNSLFDKKTTNSSVVNGEDLVTTSIVENLYPFDITISNSNEMISGSIHFKQKSEVQLVELSSSALTSSIWHHVVCQKTGSEYQIWLDGILNASASLSISDRVRNNSEFYIADNGTGENYFSGSLDEIRVYNKGLSSNEILHLSDNHITASYAYQTNRVGNIFYEKGMVVVSDPRPKYANALLGNTGNFDHSQITNGFEGQFRSTKTIHEHEIICKIRKNEFNFTQNPSVLNDNLENSSIIDKYVTNPFFNPYITTVGLYNEDRELVAVAKMGTPLEKRDDVDMNIVVRFDM